ncbi:MAG TPA: prepilin-type N-terminal cleavage/methylation domain-containing protein [Phycisphaerales bacterium]|nr:prepilin-type N-terminal cleavage/methylation domain-containing protein [Phycisphaerales bacterium]
MDYARRGFTLVEILIVVVILGILAAVVVPRFANATSEASEKATFHELQKVRRVIDVYRVRNADSFPTIEEGDGTWGPLLNNQYLKTAPVNAWVGQPNGGVIVFGEGPDDAYQTDHGWIYDPATGRLWAGGFDGNDEPHPKN